MATMTGFDTRADAIAATIASGVNVIHVEGYSTIGDGGGARYKKVASQPSHQGKFQSADGAWWELAEQTPNIDMFGTTSGDSSANQTTNRTAIQNCIDYLRSVYGGGVAIIPQKIYHTDATTITIPHNVTIQGRGPGSDVPPLPALPDPGRSLINSHNVNSNIFATSGEYCAVYDLKIKVDRELTAIGGAAIYVNGAHFIAERIEIHRAFIGIQVLSSPFLSFRNVRINVPVLDGWQFLNGSTDIVVIDDCTVEGNAVGAGLRTLGPGDITCTNSQFVGTAIGVMIAPVPGVDSASSRFSNVLCDHNVVGLYIEANGTILVGQQGKPASCSRNRFTDCDFTTCSEQGIFIRAVNGGKVNGVYILGAHICDNSYEGVRVYSDFVTSNGLTSGVVGANIRNSIVANNKSTAGVHINANIGDIYIQNNEIGAAGSWGPNAGYGILFDSGTGDYIDVSHNRLRGNTIQMNATGSNIISGSLGQNIVT